MVTLLAFLVCGAHTQGRGLCRQSPLMFSPHDKPRGSVFVSVSQTGAQGSEGYGARVRAGPQRRG